MEAISFVLSGKTAHFKKPDVNSFAYFTYNNVHKIALCGMLGAILGLGGYTQLFDEIEKLKHKISSLKGKEKKELQEEIENIKLKYPEFYEKLKDLKISIKPLSKTGYFNKKIQVFNNSVGYANGMVNGKTKKALKERKNSSNLIVREQWLENPKWQILLLDDDSIERTLFEKLKDYLLNTKTEFIPYLGKNDHPAKIEKINILEMNKVNTDFSGKISSIFMNDHFVINSFPPRGEQGFIHKEFLPISLKEKSHLYEVTPFVFTNFKVDTKDNKSSIYSFEEKNYFFF